MSLFNCYIHRRTSLASHFLFKRNDWESAHSGLFCVVLDISPIKYTGASSLHQLTEVVTELIILNNPNISMYNIKQIAEHVFKTFLPYYRAEKAP